ncbi:MAG: RNA polymerase sigma factor region1.1 domain-containing protein, partial [Tepidanaerobacteraceae bacterium]
MAKEKVQTQKKDDKKQTQDKIKAVKGLIEKGKKRGEISYGEIMDALEDIEDLDTEQIE